MDEPLTIWMIRHYYYDGAGTSTDDCITFKLTEKDAEKYIDEMFEDTPKCATDYQWEYHKDYRGEEQRVYISRFGRYGYSKYYVSPMTEGECFEW